MWLGRLRRRLQRAESPTSPEPRATPWVPCSPLPTPCKGKSNTQPFAHTFALTGRRRLYADTQGVALGCGVAALSGRSRRGLRGIAPERGSYSRIGACPYLLGPIYEPRPCKGLISRILLWGKSRQRYAPLTGAEARIDELRREIGASPYPKCEPLSGAAAQHPSSPILLSEPNPFHVWIEAIRPPIEEESREESANDINEIMCFDIYRGAAQQHV